MTRHTVALLLLAGLLGLVSMALVRTENPVGPGTVILSARPDLAGATVVSIPPLGTVKADTHTAPVLVELSPESVYPDQAQQLLEAAPDRQSLIDDLNSDLAGAFRSLAGWVAAIGAAAGLLAAALFRTRSPVELLSAVTVGALAPILLLGWAVLGFRAESFEQPTLTGALSRSPELLGPINQFGRRLDEFRSELNEIGAAAFSLHEYLAQQSPVPADAIRVLHISDLHLNPLGYDVAQQVAERFDVALVIDTGDLTAEGSELELPFTARVEEFSVPYVFVRGNHDSEATARAVQAAGNSHVLHGEAVSLAGLTVFGVGDPLFTPDKNIERGTTEEQAETKRQFAPEVHRFLEDSGTSPDIVLVHDKLIAGDIVGRVPLVLFGHSHRFEAMQMHGTRMLGVASTGGAGLKSLSPDSSSTVGMQVLYFDPDDQRLLAYDRIEVQGPQQEFSLKRTVAGGANETLDPAPTQISSPTNLGQDAIIESEDDQGGSDG